MGSRNLFLGPLVSEAEPTEGRLRSRRATSDGFSIRNQPDTVHRPRARPVGVPSLELE
jgi:hypothetical protein